MVPFNLKVLAKFLLCLNCSQKFYSMSKICFLDEVRGIPQVI